LIPDQDERDLTSMCRSLLAAECPTPLAHAPHNERMPARLWKALGDAGVLGLAIDERHGGSGGSLTDLGIFSVEAGRALCPNVVHSTVLAALAVDWLGGAEARAAWLPALASGSMCGTSAVFSARDAAVVTPVLQARGDGGAWRLRGVADFVADADLADLIIVTADAGVGTVGFVLETRSRGISIEPLAMMGVDPAFTVRLDDVLVDDPRALLGADSGGLREEDVRRVANAAVALHCLDLVGVAEAVVQRTVDYTKMREQFGRPIASFQAAQHLVADMHIALAAARLAAHSAVFWIGRGRTATRETAIARMRAAAVKQITLDAHQLHGGMGYVVDTDLHLFSERARVLSTFGGGADIAAKWLDAEMNWGAGC
jgi:alkylation response protein AidB-like acyl-CoA dehydrogenase